MPCFNKACFPVCTCNTELGVVPWDLGTKRPSLQQGPTPTSYPLGWPGLRGWELTDTAPERLYLQQANETLLSSPQGGKAQARPPAFCSSLFSAACGVVRPRAVMTRQHQPSAPTGCH